MDPGRRSFDGVGRQAGKLRPDWQEGWADLECDQCGATWVGPIGERCSWCEDALAALRAGQRALTLTAPDVDGDDQRYDAAMDAWAGRLTRAVEAGLITELDARRVWGKAKQPHD